MKTACLLAALGLAGAVAPPKISLKLEGMTSALQMAEPVARDHDLGLTQNNGQAVKSQQDWTEKCAAAGTLSGADRTTTTNQNCPFPVALAYDHQKGDVEVTTRVYRVDVDGTPQEFNVETDQIKLNEAGDDFEESDMWNHRSTFLFKYDATDDSGNHAEQVVFALILDDDSKPIFDQEVSGAQCANSGDWSASMQVEAVGDWELCKFTVTDNVDVSTDEGLKQRDGTAETNIKYDVSYLGRDEDKFNGVDPAHPKPWWHESNHLAVPWAGLGADTTGLSHTQAAALFNPTGEGAKHVGKFLVTASISDFAGVYGHNDANNENEVETAILVQDTSAPAIFLAGSSTHTQECNKQTIADYSSCGTGDSDCYIEPGVDAKDLLDSEALQEFLPVTVSIQGSSDTYVTVDGMTPAQAFFKDMSNTLTKLESSDNKPVCSTQRKLEYKASDFALNSAPVVTRDINTVDTTAPSLALNGGNTEILKFCQKNCGNDSEDLAACEAANHHEDLALDGVDPGATCSDSCDASVNDQSVTMAWGEKTFNARQIGEYIRTYSCTDGCENPSTETRTFVVEDCGKPAITIQGESSLTYEATHDIEYTDQGATCTDWVDGQLSHAVTVSGDVVSMTVPGTYTIQYNCQDLTGNEAHVVERTVVVQDTIPPELELLGADIAFLEAGFPYLDVGATATDTLDGDITSFVWTHGDQVLTGQEYMKYHSCEKIYEQNENHLLMNGDYYMTTDKSGAYQRQLVTCYFKGYRNQPDMGVFGYKIVENIAGSAYCNEIGMQPFSPTADQLDYIKQATPKALFNKIGDNEVFVCTTLSGDDSNSSPITGKLETAVAGNYEVQFHVEDKAGNMACDAHDGSPCKVRTVVVRDRLPALMSLGTQSRIAEQLADIPTVEVTADAVHGHNLYMAETATRANGFVIGAIASGVAGVALLGLSMKKRTSNLVPV